MEDSNKGQALGGGEGHAKASADEMRERRLAAMGGGGGGSATTGGSDLKPAPSPSATSGTASSTASGNTAAVASSASASANPVASSAASSSSQQAITVKQTWFVEPIVDDDDMELQAALALSMGKAPEAGKAIQADVAPAVMADALVVDKVPAQAQEPANIDGDTKMAAKVDSETTNTNPVQESYDGLVEEWWKSGDPFAIASFHTFMWDTGLTTDNDKSRWVGQGIDLNSEDSSKSTAQIPSGIEEGSTQISLLTKDHGPWGLIQSHGGPCGVMAAVQAELLRILIFGKRNPLDYPRPVEGDQVPAQAIAFLSKDLVRQALARAIALILARAAIVPSAATGEDGSAERKHVQIVLPSQASDKAVTWEDLEPWSAPPNSGTKSSTLSVFTITTKDPAALGAGAHKRQKINESREERILRVASASTAFLLNDGPPGRSAPLEAFQRPGGVMLLVMSLVATRGRDVIQGEMDDPTGTKLTAQFGHCGQELINLLLTGQAVANVFDNTLTPSGELTCRGIQARPDIGYLSQLESLRYCEVGGYYKSPKFPIWVVGSTSHFTVLFSDSSCLKESESDLILEKCKRAFKAVEGGEENGFISSSSIGSVLGTLGVTLAEHQYGTLAASLEVSDAGIILWDDFWKATSRLMTGATIDQILNDAPLAGLNITTKDDVPPLLLTQNGEADLDTKPSAKAPANESDEDLAKRLSSQWDMDNTKGPSSVAAAASSAAASPMEVEPAALSDEELARKLQAEWDAEVSGPGAGPNSVTAVNGGSQGSPNWNNFPETNSSIGTPDITPMDDLNAQDNKDQSHKLDFEKYGNTFHLYHYNGLRGGTLTPFRVTRLSAEEAVGASIALSRGNNSHSGGSGDLEDVVRTKWPSCMINWLGKNPPYID